MLQNTAHQNRLETQELRGLFEKQLKEVYWVEHALASMLSNTSENCTSKDLITIITGQRFETSNYVSRLQKIFKAIGIEPETVPYEAVECFIKEASGINQNVKTGVVKDAAIIAILQKIKHCEIACYGTMRAFAIALREEDVVNLLEQTLEEVKMVDKTLSHIAESHINIEAADKEI